MTEAVQVVYLYIDNKPLHFRAEYIWPIPTTIVVRSLQHAYHWQIIIHEECIYTNGYYYIILQFKDNAP